MRHFNRIVGCTWCLLRLSRWLSTCFVRFERNDICCKSRALYAYYLRAECYNTDLIVNKSKVVNLCTIDKIQIQWTNMDLTRCDLNIKSYQYWSYHWLLQGHRIIFRMCREVGWLPSTVCCFLREQNRSTIFSGKRGGSVGIFGWKVCLIFWCWPVSSSVLWAR